MTVTEEGTAATPETEKSKSNFSLLKLAFSTPFAILMLGLSMLSFLKRNDVLSFKGFLDSLVEMFHGVTYAISGIVVSIFDWMLPLWELKVSAHGSDLAWIYLIFFTPLMRIVHLFLIDVVNLAYGWRRKRFIFTAFSIYALFTLVCIFILILILTKSIILDAASYWLYWSALICTPLACILALFKVSQGRAGAEIIRKDFIKRLLGTAIIILSLYFAGFIELVSKGA